MVLSCDDVMMSVCGILKRYAPPSKSFGSYLSELAAMSSKGVVFCTADKIFSIINACCGWSSQYPFKISLMDDCVCS